MNRVKSFLVTTALAVGFAGTTSCAVVHTQKAPAKGLHAIVDATDQYLVGAVEGGKWLTAKSMVKKLKAGDVYRLYSLVGSNGRAVGKKPVFEEPPWAWSLKLSPVKGSAKRTAAKNPDNNDLIGTAGEWNAMPRIPKIESSSQKKYSAAVEAILSKEGLNNVRPNISQIIRADLEGDGSEEVLVTAYAPYKGVEVLPYHYTVMLFYKMEGQKLVAHTLRSEIDPREVVNVDIARYYVSGILDLDGDGVMEVVIGVNYPEGKSIEIYKLRGSHLVEVLRCDYTT